MTMKECTMFINGLVPPKDPELERLKFTGTFVIDEIRVDFELNEGETPEEFMDRFTSFMQKRNP